MREGMGMVGDWWDCVAPSGLYCGASSSRGFVRELTSRPACDVSALRAYPEPLVDINNP
ncbi:MAG: hypothetical protein J1F13_03725 [Prevotellaceae bacterium]|nr:hypothetical protein [Prevotellaceae bacterium]